jgi:26S proteasome regulatory subunit N2
MFVIDCLLNSRIPLLRQSAAWVTALAYVGSASNVALQRLLHLAVSDVNPDVRRAAVTGIGFVLSRSPKEVPGMVDLLAKSYHPHVRAGAALALGITAAGTGMPEAIAILEPLLNDLEEFVKQAAMIAMALVLQQQSDTCVPFCKKFRAYLRKLIKRKGSEMEVFGLCVAYGVMNAGGRNVVVSCNSLRGENSALPTVGLALFCNYFYWNPLTLMLPLAFHPTTIIGLDRNLQLANWKILSRGSPALYANPPSFESETEIIKNTKATLSITPQELQQPSVEKSMVEPEEEWSVLENPSRVTLNQFPGIDLNYSESYRPVCEEIFHGFVMLKEIAEGEDDNKGLSFYPN